MVIFLTRQFLTAS